MSPQNHADALYLDYVNNFISIAGYASFYGMSEKHAKAIIDACRNIRDGYIELNKGATP